jgi:acyl dehydratase
MPRHSESVAPSRTLLGHGFYWQDIQIGQRFKTFGRTLTETDVVSFVNVTGMTEPLFVDAEYRRAMSAMVGFSAPAALVYAIAEGLSLAGMAHGTGLAFLHTEIDVKGPTLVGDTIHVEIDVTEVRPAKKDGRGLVRTTNVVVNQRGETVMIYTPLRLVRGRPT